MSSTQCWAAVVDCVVDTHWQRAAVLVAVFVCSYVLLYC